MNLTKDLFNIGDRIEILKSVGEKNRIYPSQVLDMLDENTYIISGPIHKNSLVPLHIGEIIKIVYIKENKGRYMFDAKILEREHKKIYRFKIMKIGKMKRLQQRKYYRLDICIPIKKIFSLKIGNEIKSIEEKCLTKDLSGNGMKLMCNFNHKTGDLIKCLFKIYDKEIDLNAEVVRVEKIKNGEFTYALGINFIDIKNEDREAIIKFIFEKERSLIEKGMI